MKLLAITDLHGSRKSLKKILAHAGPVDLVLLGGDITHFGTPDEAEELIEAARLACPAVLAVSGNCDSAEIECRLDRLGVSLHGRGRVHQGVGLLGLAAMPPWRRGMYQFTEPQLAEFLAAGWSELAGAEPRVVLSHAPPKAEKVDRVLLGRHVGSTALRAMIDQRQPELVLCGHVHEGRGLETMGRTTVVNCGAAARRYYVLATIASAVEVELQRA